jgi:hypothetical protein
VILGESEDAGLDSEPTEPELESSGKGREMRARRRSAIGVTKTAAPELIEQAADLFEARQNGKNEPEGNWTDRVWLPGERERRPCCEGLEPDRLSDPQKLRNHCRTLLHVASLFDLDSRLLRDEVRRRRDEREETKESTSALVSVAPLRQRRAKPSRADGREEAITAEAAVLEKRIVELLAEKRQALRALLGRAGELYTDLHQRLQDEARPVETVLVGTDAQDLAAELQVLFDEVGDLLITRDTIRRVWHPEV